MNIAIGVFAIIGVCFVLLCAVVAFAVWVAPETDHGTCFECGRPLDFEESHQRGPWEETTP